jgi:ABC-type transport system involved in multi-copper enzyme maturation permease subunit
VFLRLLSIETRKTFKHPALWIGIGALVFLLALMILAGHAQVASSYQPASGGLGKDMQDALSYFSWVGVLIYAVTASVIAAFDYPDRSIQLWLTRGVPRAYLLLARLITILFFGLLMVTLAFTAILVLASFSRLVFFGVVDAVDLNAAALPSAILRVFWGALPYLALTMLLAIVSRSPLFAAGGTIIYGTLLESLLARLNDTFPVIVRYLPAQLAQDLKIHNQGLFRLAPSLPLDASLMPETQAILAIGIIFMGLGAISLAIFSRQDLGG